LFYENGPFKFANTTTPQLVDNPYSWHTVANMLYLESPAGVGFSYSTVGQTDYQNQNDSRTANDNYTFLKLWYKRYPQYLKSDFWITGESYAGVYVPTLAKMVIDGVLDKSFVIPFKGVMVGNGVSNSVGADDITVYYDFLFGHALISRSSYLALITVCKVNPDSLQCRKLKNQAMESMNNLNIYDIYADCYHQRSHYETHPLVPEYKLSLVPPCVDAFFSTQYLAMPEVLAAIHVNPTIKWTICSGLVNENYDRSTGSVVPIYQYLLKYGIRVFIFSGDSDFSVPYTDSEYWTSMEMGLTPTTDWRQWFFTDIEGLQVGGFVTEYGQNFSFATVKGAGHMVPQYAPLPALVMFQSVLAGKPL